MLKLLEKYYPTCYFNFAMHNLKEGFSVRYCESSNEDIYQTSCVSKHTGNLIMY